MKFGEGTQSFVILDMMMQHGKKSEREVVPCCHASVASILFYCLCM